MDSRRYINPAAILTAILVWSAVATDALAQEPQYNLQRGGVVTVDPDTNRASVTQDGVTTPLWDGTHRLQDGSILIIRRGTSVPREPVPAPQRIPEPAIEQWEGTLIVGYSPCEKLVHRVCGPQNKCCDREGCNLAQQLLTMEQEERAQSDRRNRMTYTSGQCQNVMHDAELFPYCR